MVSGLERSADDLALLFAWSYFLDGGRFSLLCRKTVGTQLLGVQRGAWGCFYWVYSTGVSWLKCISTIFV